MNELMNSKEDYKRISRNIRLFFAVMVMLILAIPVAVEFDLCQMAIMKGMFVGGFDAQVIYGIEVFMFFLTGICILLALKFFDRLYLRQVAEVRTEEKTSKYFAVYAIRLCLLAMPMFTGVFFYCTLLENWGLYYALAGLVSSFFCLPSAEGVEIEMNMAETHKS